MFPHAYNFSPQTYQLGYNPWTAHAQAQFRAAQAQLQQNQLAAYSVQPTLIQQAQSGASLQQQQQQQAVAMQAALQRNTNLIASQQKYKFQQPPHPHPHPHPHPQHHHHPHHKQRYNHNHNHNHKKHNKNGNSLYPKTCSICNVVCNSPLQWNMHINGKKHTKQIRGVQYQNNINNMNNVNNITTANATATATATATTSASTSTAHNSSLDSLDNNNNTNTNTNTNNNDTKREMIPSDQYVVEIDGRRKCALCHVEFTSAMCEISHIKGKRHQMAARGHPQPFSKKRKQPTVALGRCELCDVDFTSQTQKDSHLTGKKHSKNVRLVDAGQPPKKRQKTNYFSSFNKSMQPQQQPRVPNVPNIMNVMKFGGYLHNDNTSTKVDKLKPHELLQLEVERIYKEYTQIAKSSHPIKAQQIYQKYQHTYDQYIKEYNLFADSFKQEQKPIQKGENDTKPIKKEPSQNDIHNNEDEDEDEDIDLKVPKKSVTDNNHLVPTITTISTVKETKIKTENQINDDDDD